MRFLVGYEVEFYFFDSTNHESSRLVGQLNRVHGAATLRDSRVLNVREEIIQALSRAVIKATHFHSDHGRGMFDISTGPPDPPKLLAHLFSQRMLFKQLLVGTVLPQRASQTRSKPITCSGWHAHALLHLQYDCKGRGSFLGWHIG